MGPGMFDGLVAGIILLLVMAFVAGAGIMALGSWVCHHLHFAVSWL